MYLTKHLKLMYIKKPPKFKKVNKLGKTTCSKELKGTWLFFTYIKISHKLVRKH